MRKNSENHFTAFFRAFTFSEYRKLFVSTRISYGALFGRQNYDSTNPKLVMDHGLLWQLLRDLGVCLATCIRFLVGVAVLLFLLIALPLAFLARAVIIPVTGAAKGAWLRWKIRRAQRAFNR